MDYVNKTIAAYNSSHIKYYERTRNLIPYPEIEKLISFIPKGGKILDLGCAYGRDTAIFSNKGFEVVGIDLSEKLIDMAKTLHPKIRFVLMDIRELVFPDNYFDGIWCNASLLHLTLGDIKKALKEIRRILKPNGVVFISFKKGSGSKEVVEDFTTNQSRFFTFMDIENLSRLIKNAGLFVMEVYEETELERFGQIGRNLKWVYAFAQK